MAREAHVTPNGKAERSGSIVVRDLPAEKANSTIKLVMGVLSVMGVVVGITVWMINAHAEGTHKSAVPIAVWDQRNLLEDERHNTLEKKIDKLGEHAMGTDAWTGRAD
ncbi:MAG: hypothetical protein O7F08_13630 [Deltaproteobacteria bacterium]|nr:hypothetical protein [Deltaproteobacteria bacterium]